MPLRDQKTLAVSHATAYVNCSGGFCKRLYAYPGFATLKRHFVPVIGGLKSNDEEYECAEFIAYQFAGTA